MANRFALLASMTLLSALAAGCSSTGDGSASVYVKDAPTDSFDELHVVYTLVSVHAAGSADDGDDNETDGWKVLFEDSAGVDVDLLNASGARAAFLGEDDLAAGKYTQLRVAVKEAYGMSNGSRVAISLSSNSLKLNQPFDVEAGKETRLVLDFDLDASLHQQGEGSWRMTPVVGHVDAEVVEDAASGDDTDSEGEISDVDE